MSIHQPDAGGRYVGNTNTNDDVPIHLAHRHGEFYDHSYWDGRTQRDIPCRKRSCPGVARVQMAWAPDTGLNWVKCCCCGDDWNPGSRR